MKLITAIVQEKDADNVSNALLEAEFSITRLKTQGGFLRSRNVTILLALEDKKVKKAIELIEQNSKKRNEIIQLPPAFDFGQEGIVGGSGVAEVEVGGATVIVQNIEDFKRF
jgi:uncharacterized protein YaaQ